MEKSGQRLPAIPKSISDPVLEIIAVWVEDVERTSKFLTEVVGWRRHPLVFGVDNDSGGLKLAFMDVNGIWVQLIQPTTPGPGMDVLEEKGKGALVELDFGGVKDFDQLVEEMKARGVDLIGMDGKPIQDNSLVSDWAMVDGKRLRADERVAYLPPDVSRGTGIAFFWEYPNGIVVLRDKIWEQEANKLQNSPRLDHVVVLASDLSKTAAVYTDILNLNGSPVNDSLSRDWMQLGGGGSNAWVDGGQKSIWINIVAPATGTSPLLSDKRLGEGAIVELAAEVPDIDALYDEMQSKGITMTAGDGTPLQADKKSILVEKTDDRYSYFPLDKSEGMRILVFQRGPSSESVFNRRDATRIH